MLYLASMINGLLFDDGWHAVDGELSFDYDPVVQDSETGVQATPQGGPWVRFVDTAGAFIFAPLDRVIAMRHTPVDYVKSGGGGVRCGATGDHA